MQDYFLARCIQRPEDWLPCNLMVTTRLKNHLVIVNYQIQAQFYLGGF